MTEPWRRNDKMTTRDLMRLLEKMDRTCEVHADGEPVITVELVESPHGTIVMIRSNTEGTQDNADRC